MRKTVRAAGAVALLLALLVSLCGCLSAVQVEEPQTTAVVLPVNPPASQEAPSAAPAPEAEEKPGQGNTESLDENGSYDSAQDVALYLSLYGHLPDNYITKDEAEELGWNGGSVEDYAPGKAIGGDRFGNREGLLPKANGRTWTECDIDTLGEDSRGAKRIVYSNDGLIYYTDDHYESFQRLYPEE